MDMDLFPDTLSRDYDAEFQAFWSVYPPRKGNPKAEAKAEWMKLAKGKSLPPLDIMLAATRAFAAHHKMAKTEEKFIEHARKFLRNQHWNDWMRAVPRPVAAPTIGDDWADAHPGWKAFKAKILAINPNIWVQAFSNARIEPGSDGRVILVKSTFVRDQIEVKYEGMIERILGFQVKIRVGF